MNNIQKIKTYVGFAIKSRNIIYGVDSIKDSNVGVIVYSDALAENSRAKLLEFAKEIPAYKITQKEMEEILNCSKIKAFAIKSKDLACAIIENI